MLVIFDCDGVLVDSELIALTVLSDMLLELGCPMDVPACRDAFMGMHNADIARAIEGRVGRPLPGQGPAMRARMLDRFQTDLRPIPGIIDVLKGLASPRCVASSSDRARIEMTLSLTGLRSFFGDDALFSGTEVARGKPAPDLFLHAAERMGAPPEHCVVVEDSVMGVRAAMAAGMPVIGFAGGSHSEPGTAARLRDAGALPVIATMAELPAALSRFGA